MHGKNRLPVKLEDLQEDQGTYLQDGMVKMPFPLAQPQQLGEAHCLTCICNHTDKHLWCRALSARSKLWLPDHTSDTAQQNTQTASWGGKGHFPRWKETRKSYLKKRKYTKTQDIFWVSVPNPTFIHATRKFIALCYRTAEDLLEEEVL